MLVKVILVDINSKMVKAWQNTFEENPEVEIRAGSMLDQRASAWVSPTNSRGAMDGGLDKVIKDCLGETIESRVQQEIGLKFGPMLPVGHATCVPTGRTIPAFLISTPTMVSSSEDISDTMNVALACAAAFQAVHIQNALQPDSIQSVALPGLGANTGRVPVEICADLMWSGYNLFRRRAFTDFTEMRTALEAELGELGPASTAGKPNIVAPNFSPDAQKTPAEGSPSAQPSDEAPAEKNEEVDFDDFDDFE